MASFFRKSLVVLFLFLCLIVQVVAETRDGSESYKKAKAEYDAGRYEQAIPLFEKCIQENKQDYAGKGNYMIALCYIKLGKCEKTKPYFKAAYQADPVNGGASTKDKFKAKLKSCKLTIEDLASAELPNSTSASVDKDVPAEAYSSVNSSSNNSLNGYNEANTHESDNSGTIILMVFLTLAGMIVVVYFIVRYMNKSQGSKIGSNQSRPTIGKTNLGRSSVRHSSSGYRRSTASDLTNLAANVISNALHSNDYKRTEHYSSQENYSHSRDNS